MLVALAVPRAQQSPAAQPIALLQPLVPTAHAPIPRDPFRLWLAPVDDARKTTALNTFSNGTRKFSEAKYAEALPLVSVRLAGSPLAQYGQYYRGLTEQRLTHLDAAQAGVRVAAGGRARRLSVRSRPAAAGRSGRGSGRPGHGCGALQGSGGREARRSRGRPAEARAGVEVVRRRCWRSRRPGRACTTNTR